jgi:UDP-glucose 4-epimerase
MSENIKHVLVSGGAGFIGSALTRRLLAEGKEVTVVDDLSNGKRENVPEEANFVYFDLTEEQAYSKLEQIPFDAVFHLAAQTSGVLSFVDPIADMKSHLPLTFNLLQLCMEKHVARFIYASSTTIYGDPEYLPVDETHPKNPKTYYAVGKNATEEYLSFFGSKGLANTILRLPNVYGPGQNLKNKDQGMISIYLSYILEGNPILVKGLPDRFRDFIYIDDVVDGWMLAFSQSVAIGKTYNLASGERSTVATVLERLKEACGRPDYPTEYAEGTLGDQRGMEVDIAQISNELGYAPKVDLSTGLKKMYEVEASR